MAGIPDIRAKIAVSVARLINVNVDLAGSGRSASHAIGQFIATCSALLPPALGFLICRFAGASTMVTLCGCLGIAGTMATVRTSAFRRGQRRIRPGGRSSRPPSRREKRSSTRKKKVKRPKSRRRPRK